MVQSPADGKQEQQQDQDQDQDPTMSSEGNPLIAGRHDHHESNRYALLQLLISATAQAVMAVCARGAAVQGLSSGGILFVRGITTTAVTLVILFSTDTWRKELTWEDIGRVTLRACVTTSSLYLQYSALHSLPVGSVVSLLYTAAAWTLILMVILKNSPFTRTHAVVIFIKAVGAILVVERAPVAALEAIIAAALAAASAVLLAGRSSRVTPPHAALAVGVVALIAGYITHNDGTGGLFKFSAGESAIAAAIASAVSGVVSQLLLIAAAPALPLATAVVTRSLGVPFTFVFSLIILHEPIRIASMIGAIFILIAVALSAFKLHCETMLMDERT